MRKRKPTRDDPLLRRLGTAMRALVNPTNYFEGAKIRDALLADNVVVFRRTEPRTLLPKGVTHNYHHRFELVLPIAAAGRVHVEDRAYLLQPGQALLIFPHQFHHYLEVADPALNWLFITFECAKPGELKRLRNAPRQLKSPELKALLEAVEPFLAPGRGADETAEFLLRFTRLLRRLSALSAADCSIPEEQGGDPQGEILRSINAYVREHLSRRFTIADMARDTGYSVSHLRAVFSSQFGVSLGSYVRDSRISMAASRLSAPDRGSVESIAKACGFSSIWAFSRAFKQAMGRSPRAYQQFIDADRQPASEA